VSAPLPIPAAEPAPAPLSLHELRVRFTLESDKIAAKAASLGIVCFREEAKRSDEQSVINALQEDGRARVAAILEAAGEHALALAIANNGHGNGILFSLHRDGLAVDFSLFKDGRFATLEEIGPLGDWWEALGRELGMPLCWGGHFAKADGPHFSCAWQGRK
jgi:hypothetical protein